MRVFALFVVVLSCCAPPAPDGSCGGAAVYAVAGPMKVGVRTIEVDGIPVEIWYPALPSAVAKAATAPYDVREALAESEREKIPADVDTTFDAGAYRDVRVANNKAWPVILFSHGFASFRQQSSFLTAHLASWGFVVASADHSERSLAAVLAGNFSGVPSPGLLSRILDTLAAASADEASPFYRAVDADNAVATGHSAGGLAVAEVAADTRVKAWAIYASFVGVEDASKPALVMGGTTDTIAAPETVIGVFERAPQTDKRLVMLKGAGHLAFSDICEIGKDRGGLLALARDFAIQGVSDALVLLGSDGCRESDREAKQTWPVTRHYTVALAKRVLEEKALTAAQDKAAATCFRPLSNTSP